jgi:hypothetical protein
MSRVFPICSASLVVFLALSVSACDGGETKDLTEGDPAETGTADGGTDGTDGVDGGTDGGSDGDPNDQDGDGFPASEDCDDDNPAVNPGATELCNGIDDNCNDLEDENEAADATSFFLDLDGDGYGGGDSPFVSCTPPIEAVAVGGDCDDDAISVFPGAVEVCNDGVDNDCDPLSTGCFGTVDVGSTVLTGEGPGAWAGRDVDVGYDATGDGAPDLLVAAQNQGVAGLSEGIVYVVPAPVVGGTLGDSGWRITGNEADAGLGKSLLFLPDLDADGRAEVLVGADLQDAGAAGNAGIVALFHGSSLSGTGGDVPLASADASWSGRTGYHWFGTALARAGDPDNDGLPDVLVGAPGDRRGGVRTGGVYLLTGAVLNGSASITTVDSLPSWTGQSSDDYIGARLLGPGDINGDGIDDVLIGSDNSNVGGAAFGSLWIVFGPVGSGGSLTDADMYFTGDTEGDRVGAALSSAGDADGDGLVDVWVTALRDDRYAADAGGVFLLQGGTDLLSRDPNIKESALIGVFGTDTGQGLGNSVHGGEDWDGDGVADLFAGAPNTGTNAEGQALVFQGPFDHDLTPADARLSLNGVGVDDHIGNMLRISPDINGSGTGTLVIGAWESDLTGSDAGAVYLMGTFAE